MSSSKNKTQTVNTIETELSSITTLLISNQTYRESTMAENRFVLEIQRDTFAHLLNECRKNAEFIDVQLKVADKLFDAHRNVLSLYSPVLKAAISDQWSTTKICSLSDQYVDVEIVEDLLSFLYTGRIELTLENIQPICVAAHFLQISTLLEPSVGYLCKLITTENVLPLFRFSLSFELQELRKCCLQVVKENYPKVFADSQILEFSSGNFEDFIVGLKEQTCGSVQREHTFDCIIRWTEKNLLERSECLPSLLENIPLEELPNKFLAETVSTHPLVNAIQSFAPVVLKAFSNYLAHPRKTAQTLVCFLQCDSELADTQVTEMIRYDLKARDWKKLPRMLLSRKNSSITVINQRDIIVCGGEDSKSEKYYDFVEMFEWSTQTWKEMPKMPFPTSFAGIAILNNCLYVGGGCADYEDTIVGKKVLRYCFDKKQWESVKSMLFDRFDCQLIAYQNHLYAIGGVAIERYDPIQDEWIEMAKLTGMPTEDWITTTLHDDKIYVRTSKNFGVYDPEKNIWTILPKDILEIGWSLVSMNGKLLAVGGSIENVPVYEFDFFTSKWNQVDEFGPEMYIFHCAVLTNW